MPERTPTVPSPDDVSSTRRDVVGLYDSVDGVPVFAIADVATDDSWLSMAADATLDVEEWR